MEAVILDVQESSPGIYKIILDQIIKALSKPKIGDKISGEIDWDRRYKLLILLCIRLVILPTP